MFVLPDIRGRRVNGVDRGLECLRNSHAIRIEPALALLVRPEPPHPRVVPFVREEAGQRVCRKVSLDVRFGSGASVSLKLDKPPRD